MKHGPTHVEPAALTIGALAQLAGVGVETIRYYQRRGLLNEPERPHGSFRRYGASDVARLDFVKRSQQLGFSLDEVSELLRLDVGTHCSDARTLAETKLADVRRKLEDLRHIELALADLVDRCSAGRGKVKCPLISGLQAPRDMEASNGDAHSARLLVAAPVDESRRRRKI
jgi:MerR family mercuric resistance operon transcriptional regulator